jgi:hypothetical protein
MGCFNVFHYLTFSLLLPPPVIPSGRFTNTILFRAINIFGEKEKKFDQAEPFTGLLNRKFLMSSILAQ